MRTDGRYGQRYAHSIRALDTPRTPPELHCEAGHSVAFRLARSWQQHRARMRLRGRLVARVQVLAYRLSMVSRLPLALDSQSAFHSARMACISTQ